MHRFSLSFQINEAKFRQGDRYAAFLYDAVLLYAIGMNEILNKGLDYRNGTLIASYMRGKFFKGE